MKQFCVLCKKGFPRDQVPFHLTASPSTHLSTVVSLVFLLLALNTTVRLQKRGYSQFCKLVALSFLP